MPHYNTQMSIRMGYRAAQGSIHGTSLAIPCLESEEFYTLSQALYVLPCMCGTAGHTVFEMEQIQIVSLF